MTALPSCMSTAGVRFLSLMALTAGQSFHFCRFYKGEPFMQAIARHEHYLASMMQLKPGMRVLDIGCGIGGPAREIARFADVEIVGINNNEFQVGRARTKTARAGLQDQLKFVKGNFMALEEQFGPNSFDAVYAIEATCHAPTFEGVYGEVMKVLKPGGIVSIPLDAGLRPVRRVRVVHDRRVGRGQARAQEDCARYRGR